MSFNTIHENITLAKISVLTETIICLWERGKRILGWLNKTESAVFLQVGFLYF